jgi:hypothetical protein
MPRKQSPANPQNTGNHLKQQRRSKASTREAADNARNTSRSRTTDQTATHQGGSHKGGGVENMNHPSQKGGVKHDLEHTDDNDVDQSLM